MKIITYSHSNIHISNPIDCLLYFSRNSLIFNVVFQIKRDWNTINAEVIINIGYASCIFWLAYYALAARSHYFWCTTSLCCLFLHIASVRIPMQVTYLCVWTCNLEPSANSSKEQMQMRFCAHTIIGRPIRL